ncbi:MAG: urea ABC transporter permease subunit UrtB [Rhodospirillales bacterium]|nr:urea ABC transporter permease subunit UrtB [Rhodospirillales bacterium]
MRFLRVLLLLIALVPLAARAQDDPFAGLAGSYDDIRKSVDALAVSGSAQAEPTIAALQSGTLFVAPDKSLWIRQGDATLNARTGAKAAAPDGELKKVRLNNGVRRAIEAAMGSLTLFSADPDKRMKAAQALFAQPDPAALPVLDRALAREQDAGVKRAMEQAHAAALLAKGDVPVPDRLAAIAVLRARGDLDASNLLAALSNQPPQVAAAASHAIAAIARVQRLWAWAQAVFYGISLGSVLLLAAAGLAITFGVMGVINMAHGEMVMLGAYTTFVVQQLVTAYAPALTGAGVLLAVPLAFVVAGAVGIAIERLLIRFLYGRPLETLLATWGLSLTLQQAVRSIFGASNRNVTTPGWMSGAAQWGGVTITFNRLYIIVFAVLVLAALMAVLRATPLGLRMRAVTQNRRMAAAMGIRTPWIDALTFGLGSGVAGMAGVALSQIDNVSPNLGQGYIIDSFMVVVFGGVGNLWGTLVSALTLGIVNKFLEPVAGAVLGKIVVLVLLIVFIQRKPRGLFPLRGRAVEA